MLISFFDKMSAKDEFTWLLRQYERSRWPVRPLLAGIIIRRAADRLSRDLPPIKADKTQCCNGRPYDLPPGFDLVCSADWRFTGPADGMDLWDRWTIEGPGDPPDCFVRPWHDHRIIVVGYEMTKLYGPPHTWFAVGSGIQPDIFLWMGKTETHVQKMFPKGLGHPWPTREEAQQPGFLNIIDIHGAALGVPLPTLRDVMRTFLRTGPERVAARTVVAEVCVELTIYYTPWDHAAPSPPSPA